MAKTTVPPSRARSAQRGERRPVDVRGWLGGIRLSGFAVIMLGLVVLGVFVLVPTLGTYIGQQQQITALEKSVSVTQDEVDGLDRQKERWTDPAYITTQARERLYYVKPGEVVYLVDNDLSQSALPREQATVSTDVEQTRTDWMAQLVTSVTSAGTARTAVAIDPTPGVSEPTPSATN